MRIVKNLIIALALSSITAASAFEVAHQKYDSNFGATVTGAYGFASNNESPDVGGFFFNLHGFVDAEYVHEFSLTSGGLWGSHTPRGIALANAPNANANANDNAKLSVGYIPLLAGYTAHFQISDRVGLYLGGKLGVTFADIKYGSVKEAESKLTFTFNIGLKIQLTSKWDLLVGYEFYKIHDISSYHVIELGFGYVF